MSVPYVVRKKVDLTSGERKELWYGVPGKILEPIRKKNLLSIWRSEADFIADR